MTTQDTSLTDPSPSKSNASTFHLPSIFRAKDADIILKSHDGVEFRVYRRLLIESSPFFRTMFDLPQPPAGKVQIPTVDMQESATTLCALLQCIYPVTYPRFSTLEELIPVLKAGHKYDMESVLSALRRTIIEPRFLDPDPLGVYAIACQMGLTEEAQLASRRTLHVDLMSLLLPHPTKLGSMLAVDLVQLVALRVARASRAKAIIKRDTTLASVRCACGLPPQWLSEWKKRAIFELDKHPVSDMIFSGPFLGEIMAGFPVSSCLNCSEVRFEKQQWMALKAEIDSLPDTI